MKFDKSSLWTKLGLVSFVALSWSVVALACLALGFSGIAYWTIYGICSALALYIIGECATSSRKGISVSSAVWFLVCTLMQLGINIFVRTGLHMKPPISSDLGLTFMCLAIGFTAVLLGMFNPIKKLRTRSLARLRAKIARFKEKADSLIYLSLTEHGAATDAYRVGVRVDVQQEEIRMRVEIARLEQELERLNTESQNAERQSASI